MHDADIVHGDLTTSNMMLRSEDAAEVVRWRFAAATADGSGGVGTNALLAICAGDIQTMIDFGLANTQPLPEDKAVDLYVMERAFDSTHVNSEALVAEVLRAYKACSRRADNIFQKLSQVRLRGRKRTMVG